MDEKIIVRCRQCKSPIEEAEIESKDHYKCLVCGNRFTYDELVKTAQKQFVNDAAKRIRKALSLTYS